MPFRRKLIPIDAIAAFQNAIGDAISNAIESGLSDFEIDQILKNVTDIERQRWHL
jgi:hypothetical protein